MGKKYKSKSFIIANNVRSAFNVGSLFRIAESLQIGLILQGITPHPAVKNDTRLPYIIDKDVKQITKSAVATINTVPFWYFKEIKQTLSFLNGTIIYCLEEGLKGDNLYSKSLKIESPYALVVGNEVTGVDKEFINVSKSVLYIPMGGLQKSLNVSVSTAIALFEIERKLKTASF